MSKDKLKLEYMSVNDIKPFDGNPRKHPEDALKKLVDSINHFGWTNPILLDEDNIIVAGHARLKAAKKAGMEEVPVIKLPLSGKEAALYNIADNKTQELTEWDWPKLGDLFHELDTGEFDLEITGFSETEISGLMHGLDESGKINKEEVWKEAGMPGYESEDCTAYKSIIIHFADEAAVGKFAKLIKQTITNKTKYLWFPKLIKEKFEIHEDF